MTYYKYAEREANSQINWAEVSKGLTDTITQIDQDRQTKKAAIDDATRKDMLTLADAPKGENTTASEWTIKYANDMMNYRLTIDRLLKSGKMSLRDYQVAAQNSKDSTNLVFTISKEYQDEYKSIMDRKRAGDSSRFEVEMAAMNESLANISSTVPYINSTNGMVYLATGTPGEDGVQQMGDNYVSLQALRNRVKTKIDKYSLSDGLATAAGKLGEYTISELGKTDFRRTGVVTDISDPTIRDTYTQWEDATVKEIMASDYQLASILADNMNTNPRTGGQYRITTNKAEFDADKSGDVVLMANENGSGIIMPQFKEEQRKDVEAFIKGQIKNYIDQKTEKRPFQEPGVDYAPEYVVRGASDRNSQETNAGYWQQLRWGTQAQKEAAAQILLGTKAADKKGLYNMSVTPDGKGLRLEYTEESGRPSRTISIDPNTSSREWAALGVELHGIEDADRAVRAAGGGANKPFQAPKSGALASRDYTPPSSDAYEKLNTSLTAKPLADFVTEDGAEETASQLNAAYSDFGFEFDFEESGLTDDVIVKYNGQEVGKVAVDNKSIGAGNIALLMRKTLKAPPDPPSKDDAAAATKGKGPIAAPGGGTFGSGSAKRKIKG
jgi:hypothetical protein